MTAGKRIDGTKQRNTELKTIIKNKRTSIMHEIIGEHTKERKKERKKDLTK